MVKAHRLVMLALLMLVPASNAAAATAPAMYGAALARERAVRARLAEPDAAQTAIADAREVVAQYEAIVRRHPSSGYCDNALWQAARLALDAYDRFGDERDWRTGVRLLRRLAAMYPTSRLAKHVPEQLTAAGSMAGTTGPQGPALQTPVGTGLQAGPGSRSIATMKAVQRTVLPDVVRVTIELDAEVRFHEERLSDPPRVFVDLTSTRAAPSLLDQTLRFEGDADIIRQVRIGRHPNATTRVVLDADGMSSYSVYALYSPYRLVIDCARSAAAAMPAVLPAARITPIAAATPIAPTIPAPVAAPAIVPTSVARPSLRARRVAVSWGRSLPASEPEAAAVLRDAHAEAQHAADTAAAIAATAANTPPRTHIAPLAPLPSPPAKNAGGGFSIARQLGLNVSRIVIDPGHGGHDPGAKGKNITEAELVLDVALRLEALLQKIPGVEVVLTRRTDEFVPLPDRTALANRVSADLFLSIHANASASAQARGIETYFLNFANNQSAAAVAARENAESAQAMGALPDFVKAIALNNKLDESKDFATHVQRAMIDRLRALNRPIKDLGVKQAPFVVLIGAAMPSVLAEVSFVTNPQEARLLRGPAYRQRIAEALLSAIRKYQTSLKGVTAVAHQ